MATATAGAESFADQHREGITKLARIGYAAHGLVYLLVAYMVFQFAFGGQAEGTRNVIASIRDEFGGEFVLGLIALGLAGYAVWRFCQGFFDADHHGSDAKGYAVRTGMIVSGIVQLALAWFALSLIFGWGWSFGAGGGGAGGGGNGAQNWTARLMAQPFGQVLVALVGVAILGGAIALCVKAVKEKYKETLMLRPDQWRWADPVAKAGLFARAVVYFIIGGFFIVAAWQHDPQESRGLAGALQTLREQPFGTWLLVILSIGLLAYAVYDFVQARYRIIRPTG